MAHSKLKKAAGHASGTALGYIIGGAKGAKYGYKVGGWLASDKTHTTPRTLSSPRPSTTTSMAVLKRKRSGSFSARGGSKKVRIASKKSGKRTIHARKRSGRSTKKKNSSPSRTGVSSTSTNLSGRPGWMKLYKKLAQPLHLTSNHGTRVSAGSGRQVVKLLTGWYDTPFVLGKLNFVNINDALTASSPPVPALAPNQATTRRFQVNKVDVDHRIRNQTNTPVKVTLYDITPRREVTVASLPQDDWNAGLLNQAVNVVGNANSAGYGIIGTTPFQSKMFTQRWKVLNVSSFMLEAGSEHHHYVNLKIGGMFDNERVSSAEYTKGITRVTMAVLSGGVVGSITPVPTNVSTSVATLDIVSTTRITCRMLEKSTVGTLTYNNLVIIPDAEQQMINQDTDAVTIADAL